MPSKFFGRNSKKNQKQSSDQETSQSCLQNQIQWRPGDILLDRYRINQVFSGAMGRVYISEHLGWKVPIAIKVPKEEILANKEGLQRTLTEANSWVAMGMHPNVATCYYVLNIQDIPHLFIEYVDGGDLSSWLKSGRCSDLRTMLSLAVQFCHGMEFTHSKGIIHRDIKPGNILLTKDALLKITDFGIVQTKDSKDGTILPQGNSEETIGFRGTPSYASPEQFRDTHGVDKRSDIFSFGICLWLMFCGKRPYSNNAVPGKATPTPANAKQPFPTPLKDLLVQCVAPNPADRFQTFAELRSALNAVHLILFRVPCPYMELDFSDLLAENLNNKAVSLFELGKKKEAAHCLQKALDANDTLMEAFFNYTLSRWRKGTDAKRLLKQVVAFQKRVPNKPILDTLAQAIRCDVHKDTWAINPIPGDIDRPQLPSVETYFPEFILCLPKNSVEVFQKCQLNKAAKANMTGLLKAQKFRECHDILLTAWENKQFQKDPDFQKIYRKLFVSGKTKQLKASVHIRSFRHNRSPIKTILTFPGDSRVFALCQNGQLLAGDLNRSKKLRPLRQYTTVQEASVSQDGSFLVLAKKGGQIDLINLKSQKREAQFRVKSSVTALAFNRTNSQLAVGLIDGSILMFSIADKLKLHTLSTSGNAVTAIGCFNRSDDFISSSEDGKIFFWSYNQIEPILIVPAHEDSILSLADGNTSLVFASTGTDNMVRVWDRQSGQCKKTLSDPVVQRQATLFITEKDNYLINGGDDDLLSIGNPFDNKIDLYLDARGDGVTTLAQGSAPNLFLSGAQDGSISLWMLVYELEFL